MDSDDKLTKALAAMERMEKLMEALNNDLEMVKEENRYLKVVVEMNNDPTNPDHPLYEPPARSHFSPPTDSPPLPPAHTPQPSSGRPEIKYREPKIAAPLPFDGKRENTESFLNACQLYISARPSEFQTEDQKMHWVMSYMQSGSARLHNGTSLIRCQTIFKRKRSHERDWIKVWRRR